MALHDTMQRVPLADIWVEPGRQRKDVTVDDLLPSIKRQGVLVPVIVEAGSWPTGQPFRLIVGERRLVASRQLGLEDIPARLSSDLDPRESQIIELAENLKRKDLSWQELVGAIARIHQLFVELDPEWTQAETAEQVGVTPTLVSMYLQVHREVSPAQAPDHLRNAGTVREAFNIIKRKEQRNAGDALQQLAEFTMPAEPALPPVVAPATAVPPASSGVTAAAWPAASPAPRPIAPAPPPPVIQVASFLEWAPAYSGPKFNLLHCDFPYGIDLFAAADTSQMKKVDTYADDSATFWPLVECLVENLDRFFSLSGHIVFWHSGRTQWAEVEARFQAARPEVQWLPHPFIWFKSDNVGLVTDVRRRPRHVYEVAMLGYRGDRHLVVPKGDCYPCPTDNKLHPSAKPEPMLKHLLSMLCDETSSVLDPTAGSGSALRAASGLGARSVLGLEVSPEYAERANQAFRNAQLMRAASRAASPTPTNQESTT